MQVKTYDITNMSNRQIEDLCHQCEVELRERRIAQQANYEDAMTHGLYIDEVDEAHRKGYHDYLRENMHHPMASDLLQQYYSDEEYKQSIRNQSE